MVWESLERKRWIARDGGRGGGGHQIKLLNLGEVGEGERQGGREGEIDGRGTA